MHNVLIKLRRKCEDLWISKDKGALRNFYAEKVVHIWPFSDSVTVWMQHGTFAFCHNSLYVSPESIVFRILPNSDLSA